MNKDSFMKALCMIDEDLMQEANTPNIDLIMNEKSKNPYIDNEDDDLVSGVDIYNGFVLRKILAVAMSLAIIVSVTVTGRKLYSQQKNRNILEINSENISSSCNTENSYMPIEITDDYEGPILGIDNWHIEKNKDYTDDNIHFINDDTGDIFASYSNDSKSSSYLADINNDGNYELVCNTAEGYRGNDYISYTLIFRSNNGLIECGRFIDDFEAFAEDNGLITSVNADKKDFYNGVNVNQSSLYVNYYYDVYCPDKNAIILKSKYDDKEYEIDYERFIFTPFNNNSYYYPDNNISYPIKIDEYYQGPIFGIKNWHIEKEGVSSSIEIIRFINDANGNIFAVIRGNKDSFSFYLTDIDNNGITEMVCNYQYINKQSDIYDHVIIHRYNDNATFEFGINKDTIETFVEEGNVDLAVFENYTERYIPEQNKIILNKQDSDTEYVLGLEDYEFYSVLDYYYERINFS